MSNNQPCRGYHLIFHKNKGNTTVETYIYPPTKHQWIATKNDPQNKVQGTLRSVEKIRQYVEDMVLNGHSMSEKCKEKLLTFNEFVTDVDSVPKKYEKYIVTSIMLRTTEKNDDEKRQIKKCVDTLSELFVDRGYLPIEDKDVMVNMFVRCNDACEVREQNINILFISSNQTLQKANNKKWDFQEKLVREKALGIIVSGIQGSDLPEDYEEDFNEFNITSLQYNITKHRLVPTHKILEGRERRDVLSKYRVSEMPVLFRTDPVAKWYGMREGDICRVTRSRYTTYRYIRNEEGARLMRDTKGEAEEAKEANIEEAEEAKEDEAKGEEAAKGEESKEEGEASTDPFDNYDQYKYLMMSDDEFDRAIRPPSSSDI